MFWAALDGRNDPELCETRLHVSQHLSQVEVALGCPQRQHLVYLRVAARVQRRERKILELLFQIGHTESMGQRRVNVERLARSSFLFELRQRRNGPQIVETVGQLNYQHPQI